MKALYEFDASRFKLGKLCPKQHTWSDSNHSLRYISGSCVQCAKEGSSKRSAEGYNTQWMRRHRLFNGRPSRAKDARPGQLAVSTQQLQVWRAIRAAGRSPSVARLVMNEQKRYWGENPEAKAEHDRQWAQAGWWLTYQTRPDLRLYHREKSRRRKARDRGATAVQVSATAIRQRFNEFGNSCAYCGAQGDMQIEHVVATSQGGAHDIGNIVPACSRCNTSKRTTEMERWYRAQPFFSELRLRRIRRVLHAPMGQQLALALC